jgi:hypothetical protein
VSISPLNKNAMKVSRRLTGDFTNIALPLKAMVAESAAAQAGGTHSTHSVHSCASLFNG